MGITLEQAIEYAAGYQRQLDEANETLKSIDTSHSLWRQTYLLRNEAKMMLEWYQGYEDKDNFGNPIHIGGIIQKLAGEAQRLKEASNLGERFSSRTFGNFDPRRDKTAFDACRNYANNELVFRSKKNSLLLFGGVGSGKTHLAAAIANTFIDRSIPVLFATFSSHLGEIRDEFDHTGQRKYLSMMKNTPVLVIDDLGKEKKTEWTQQILYDVVNYRYEHLLPIIITSNFDTDSFANYVGEAVWSRLYEMSGAVTTAGKDYRQE